MTSGPTGAATGRRSVVVVGGGLAGITAAVRLADEGAAVTLLEGRPRLGGATASFDRHGLTVDTGQHVFLRCYTAYRGLLDRLGATSGTTLQPRFRVPVVTPGGRSAVLRRWPLPAPLHLLPVLVDYPLVPLSDRLRLARAMSALRGVDPADRANDTSSFGSWLAAHGQRSAAVDGLWRLVALAALNGEPADVSLALAARVFRTGLLERADAPDIGVPAVPLGALHAEPAARVLADLGATVRLGSRVRTITKSGEEFTVRTDDAEVVADAVVVAVPPDAAAAIVPAGAGAAEVWSGLGSAPIVNVHVVYDRPVTPLPFAATVGSPVQWVFDRSRPAGLVSGQYLAVSLSGAQRLVDSPTAQLRTTYLAALEQLFPAARAARVVDFFVTRERHATFRQSPGTAALRPAVRTALPGLLLAGAWTDTGWPDTMEGAVRSGTEAAREAATYLAARREPSGVAA